MTTKKKPAAKKKSHDIPLDNIPDRLNKTAYTDEFKTEAAKRVIAGESAESVARAMSIPSSSVIHKWKTLLEAGLPFSTRGGARTPHKSAPSDNVAGVLRQALANASKARDERLEAAAAIVEVDGNAPEIAKKIRTLKRSST